MATAMLDRTVLRANARAWRRHSGTSLRAVIKADAYGWGLARVVSAVDDEVDGYCVVDLAEFDAVRRVTTKPVAILGDVAPGEIARLLDGGGIPNLGDARSISAAKAWAHERGRPARVGVGLHSAAAWAGVDERAVANAAALLANEALEVECWTHLTDPSLYAAQRGSFALFVESLRAAGANVVGCNVDATASDAAEPTPGMTSVRIGVGLFGSGSAQVKGLACAFTLRAPIVRVVAAQGQLLGYGTGRAGYDGYLAVVRCGYGDGFPRIVEAFGMIRSVGMQYTVLASPLPPTGTEIDLISAATELDRLAAAARLLPHEVVVHLGQVSRVV